MKVVVVAGGMGTRIAPVGGGMPKAMMPVGEKPVLELQVEMARRQGYREFLFVTGHMGEQIEAYFGDGGRWGVDIEYFRERAPLGTAGALSCLGGSLTEDFFVFYGDTVMDFDMGRMLSFHREKRADATLFVHPNDHPEDSDLVELDGEGRVTRFHHRPHGEGLVARNIAGAAVYVLSPRVLGKIPTGVKCHVEKDVLPACLEGGMRLYGYLSAEYVKDMGTPGRYRSVCEDVESGKVGRLNRRNPRPAVFLDRDGVVTREVGLLRSPGQLELLPGAAEAVRRINVKGYLAVVATNQPVVARNLCSVEELEYIHAKLETMLGREHAYLNAIYYCPHHPDSGFPGERKEYKVRCRCRKPAPGMLLRAREEWNIDMGGSYMIGDRESDVQAGEAAGCGRSFMIPTNRGYALLELLERII